MFESRLDGRTNEAWDQLVTQQQELMSVDVFAACSEPEPVDEPMVEVLDTFFESIRIPGTMQSLQTVAVDLRLTGRQDGKPVDRVRRMTVAEVDDVWRWALDPDEIVECLGPDHRPAGSDEADEPEDLEEPQDAPGPEG